MKINNNMKISYLKFRAIVLFAFIVSIASCEKTNKSEPSKLENDIIEETTINVKKDSIDDIKEVNKIEETNPELNTPDQVVLKYVKWRYNITGKEADEELFNIGLFTPDFLEKHPRMARLGCTFCAGDAIQGYLIKEPIINGATATVSTLFCWYKSKDNDGFSEEDILRETDSDCKSSAEAGQIELWKIDGVWLINKIP